MNNAAPFATIGLPVFNGERFLRQAIDSALAQDWTDFELVISDNASTDGTQAICEDYAKRDCRVRYYRNPENMGASRNFKKTVELARGTYFTWLAHDDCLSSKSYLSEITGFMERHGDVVLCGCSMQAFQEENPRQSKDIVLEKLLPEQSWQNVMLEFFRWPQTVIHFVIYGVYRREALLKCPLEGRIHRGKPVVVDMEYPILARLCQYGRIVALPQALRNYRSSANSSAFRDIEYLSTFDQFFLASQMKWTLFKIAMQHRLPLRDKARLLKVTLGNCGRAPFGRIPEFRESVKALRKGISYFQSICDERLHLITQLDAELKERLKLIEFLDGELKKQSKLVETLQSELKKRCVE